MKIKDQRTIDLTLNTNLNDLAHNLLRELAMAAKKVSIYGSQHKVAERALEKPFLICSQIFRIKKYVNINLQQGLLYILNIRVKDSIFNRDVTEFMQVLDARAILFERSMTMAEFSFFVNRMVKKVGSGDHSNLLVAHLEKNAINSIEVDSEKALGVFENHRQYRGDVHGDFSARRFLLDRLGDDLVQLGSYYHVGWDELAERGIDFEPDMIDYLLPEKMAQFEIVTTRDILVKLLAEAESAPAGPERDNVVAKSKAVYKLLDFHPERSRIAEYLQESFSPDSVSGSLSRDLASPAELVRSEASDRIDAIMRRVFVDEGNVHLESDFKIAFQRLSMTGQKDKAVHVIDYLLNMLEAPEPETRHKSLNLLLAGVNSIDLPFSREMLVQFIDRIVERVEQNKATYEYSELIWMITDRSLQNNLFGLVIRLLECLAEHRTVEGDITTYDSIVAKKVFSTINHQDIIDSLTNTLIGGEHEAVVEVRQIMILIGTEQVAMRLSHIISHPVRQIRQQALRILGELGKASLKVFSQIIVDDDMFERDSDRHELPDARWYIVRNSIFVLGLLADQGGVGPLRLRISDRDVRVRREIVSSLGKIGGEDACDLLVLMSSDLVREISEAAIIAAGLIAEEEQAPLLIDAIRRNPHVSLKVVAALGRIGGQEAEDFLIGLIDSDEGLSAMAQGRVACDELKLAVIKALGSIGNARAIHKLEHYQDNMSSTQKIFFRKSAVNRAISDILSDD